MIDVPWNASWSGEQRYEVRPCRYSEGRPAMWQPFALGIGRPIFAKPHFVRQRRSVREMLCTVCGEHMPADDRWWFALGEYVGEFYATGEAPVHHACALRALDVCPYLKRNGCAADLARFPTGHTIIASMIGGPPTEKDFGVRLPNPVVGALKFAWPKSRIQVVMRA